jgi:hypothetical protein
MFMVRVTQSALAGLTLTGLESIQEARKRTSSDERSSA